MYSKQSLQMLDTVARMGSFTAAGVQLHKVPSAISYAVRQVEKELGVKLFHRLARKVELTEAGEHFINEARQLLRQMEEVKEQTRRVENGYHKTVKLTLDNIVKLEQLKPLIEDFYTRFDHAELQINMEVFNGSWEAISEGRADIVVGATSAIPVSGDYGVKSMGSIDWSYVMASDHPLAHKSSNLTDADLSQIPAICLDDTSIILPKRHTWHSSQQRRLLLPNWFSAIECLKNKVGMGYMPNHMAQRLINSGELIEVNLSTDKPISACCLVWRKSDNKLVEWLVDYLGDSAKLHQDWLA